MRVSLGLALLLLGAELSVGGSDETPGEAMVPVSRDYGSGPGKDSNRWVGEREVPIRYQPGDCIDRFRLKTIRHEYVLVDREGKKSSPAFIVATFQKLRSGLADPPYLEIVRPKYTNGGKKTKKKHVDTAGFRLDFPPNRIDNWKDANIEVTLSVPNHNVHNPYGWTEVIVACE